MQAFAAPPALRSHLESQVNFFTELSHKSYDTLRQLSELNLRLTQQLLEDTVATSRDLLNALHPFQYASIALHHAGPVAQHLRSYQQALMALMAGAQTGIAQTARERMPEAGRSAAAAAEEFARRSAEAVSAISTRH